MSHSHEQSIRLDPPLQERAFESQIASQNALTAQLDGLRTRIPELNSKYEDIARGGSALIETFQVTPEFFDSSDRSLIFISLASMAGQTMTATEQPGTHDNRNELLRRQQFVSSAAFILTRNYAQAYPELREQYKRENDNNKEAEIEAAFIRRYVQPEVSNDLSRYVIDHSVFAETQRMMGIDSDAKKSPYINVLAVGRNSLAYFAFREAGLTWQEMEEWYKGLSARSMHLAQQVSGGELILLSGGFTMEMGGGEEEIFMPMHAAEIIMAEEQGLPLSDYGQSTRESYLGSLRHEYVHTKFGVRVEGIFGRTLEERRAEYYSGDSGEYYDVKRFFGQMGILTGQSIRDKFDQVAEARRKGQNLSIYELVAKDYGVDKVAEIAAVQPEGYLRFTTNTFAKEMLAFVGGYDAVVRRFALETDRGRVVERLQQLLGGITEWTDEDRAFVQHQFATVFDVLDISLADILPEDTDRGE